MSEWQCRVCGKVRSWKQMAVLIVDCSKERGLPPGRITVSVTHCTDNPDCVARAKEFGFIPGITSPDTT